MKKTFSLLGLLFIGLMLLTNPATGILSASDAEPIVASAESTSTESGEPPPEADDEEPTSTTANSPTTTSAVPVAATEPEADSYSVVGSVESSEFGPFQVQVYFTGETIVAVEAIQLPTDRKSNRINDSAVPLYEEAVIDAQSADIDVISGATVTWDNYTASLQAALDEARA